MIVVHTYSCSCLSSFSNFSCFWLAWALLVCVVGFCWCGGNLKKGMCTESVACKKSETSKTVVNSFLALSLLLHFQQQIVCRTDFEAVPCPLETHNVVHSPFRAPLHLDSGFYFFDGQSTLIKCTSSSPCNSAHPVSAAAAVVVVDVGPPTSPNKV